MLQFSVTGKGFVIVGIYKADSLETLRIEFDYFIIDSVMIKKWT